MKTVLGQGGREACPLCGETAAVRPWLEREDAVLAWCRTCDLGFVERRGAVGQDQYVNNETSKFEYYEALRPYDLQTFTSRLQRAASRLEGPRMNRVLDIGTNTGTYLEAAERAGWHAVGVEPNPFACDVVRGKDLTVVNAFFDASFAEALAEKDKFDIVHIGDVVEHVVDPVGFIRAARRCLRKGGVLMMVTPNFRSSIARWGQVKPREHLLYFTPRSFESAIRAAGAVPLVLTTGTRRRRFAPMQAGTTIRTNPWVGHVRTALMATRLDTVVEWGLLRWAKDELLALVR